MLLSSLMYGALAPSSVAADRGFVAGAARATMPIYASVVIPKDGATKGYATKVVTISQDGLLSVVNLDTIDHTVTSVAIDSEGDPLFDVIVPPGATVSVPAASLLAPGTYDFFCTFHPNMTGELIVEGDSGGVTPALPKFEQPLLIPPVRTGDHIRLPMKKTLQRVLPHGRRTPLWTYGNSWPGPTIRRPAGHATDVTFTNELPRSAGSMSVHFHGDHHAARFDGQPGSFLVRRGRPRTYHFPLTYAGKPEPSSFFWYHDHRMDVTARNNWQGLQGMFIVDDARPRDLRLPEGRHDIPLLVGDRSFTEKNRFTNPFRNGPTMIHTKAGMAFTGPKAPPNDATVGTRVLVNGRYAPFLRVSATRYRLRLLNASSFSAYNFALSDGRPFVQIGTGNGLLRQPVVRQNILLGPAQRADVIVDFHREKGQNVVLSSIPRTDGSETGTGSRSAALMEFRVRSDAPDRSRIPASLPGPGPIEVPNKVSKTWTFGLSGDAETGTFWSINGRSFDMDRVDFRVPLGSTQRWRIRNVAPVSHYVHIHAEQWHTVTRAGEKPPPWERGLEDTWRLDPGEEVVVAAKFTDYTGPFMIHCHMLDHEDHGMMARFLVTDRHHKAAGTAARAAEHVHPSGHEHTVAATTSAGQRFVTRSAGALGAQLALAGVLVLGLRLRRRSVPQPA
ncbi:MAG TPA: multicopper oxidase domain-containing protein [Nocardioidaceae bacterium]|nr:multicopper oxidase domain-containing protein [Nocardioidaceae bacterium]